MHWLALLLAGVMEAGIPALIIRSQNFTHPGYTLLLLVVVICSVWGLRYAIRRIPLAVAYLVWTALGVLGTALVGVLLLEEQLSLIELASLTAIVIAVAGLRLSSA